MPDRVRRPEGALERLRQLRSRRRALRSVTGVFRLLTLITIVAWVTFLIDWGVNLPVAVRWVQLVAAIVVIGTGFRFLLLSTRTPIAEDRLASMVEETAGDLEQTLITAVQLTHEDNPRKHLYSKELLDRTVAIAEERMSRIDPGTLLSKRRSVAALLLLLALSAPVAAGALSRGDLTSTFWQRNVLLRDVPWPRSYELEVLHPADEVTLLAAGESLSIEARRIRGGNARAVVEVVFPESEGRSESEEEVLLDRKGENNYRHLFSNLVRDFNFRIHCGDWVSARYDVQVRSRPRVEDIELTFSFPLYTGLPQEGEETKQVGGHLKVPVGTGVSYSANTSVPLRSAHRVEAKVSGDGSEEPISEMVTFSGNNRISGSFEAVSNGNYWFDLVSEDGFDNPRPIRYRIAVVPDIAPSIEVVEPGRNIEVTPRALLVLKIRGHDDYGISSSRLLVSPEEGRPGEVREFAIPLLGNRVREGESSLEIDLEKWRLQTGQQLQYHVEAVDGLGQIGISRKWTINVLSEEDLERITQDELSLLSERLEETWQVQRDVRRELENVLDASRASGAPLDAPSVRHSRLSQDRVNTRLEDGVERLQEIVDRLVQNRLTDVTELPWIEGLRDRLDDLSRNEATEALAGLEELTIRAGNSQASLEELEEAIDRVRASERELEGIVTELKEWGDLRTVIRKVEELLRSQKELETRVETKVREALGNDGSDDGGGR
ncbi:MAG TPA: hypothetical protein EYN79_02790 [Planctomycetes bacterium]|nr:hypothetical protein [Planctomycetota bacterium]HIN80976.1 hypothetical protein [Planctomycetota bacterium]